MTPASAANLNKELVEFFAEFSGFVTGQEWGVIGVFPAGELNFFGKFGQVLNKPLDSLFLRMLRSEVRGPR